MQKVGDTGDISLLFFFLAGANFWDTHAKICTSASSTSAISTCGISTGTMSTSSISNIFNASAVSTSANSKTLISTGAVSIIIILSYNFSVRAMSTSQHQWGQYDSNKHQLDEHWCYEHHILQRLC